MLTLNDLHPTDAELEATDGMPEQVAVGWIRAARRVNHGRRITLAGKPAT
ncbi:hypothetical protein [Mycolicibacterium fortuitum]|nr:hypothetical protein [Mycolicibacterium fortuitum]